MNHCGMSNAATNTPWLSVPADIRRRFSPRAVVEHSGDHFIFRALDLESKNDVAFKCVKTTNSEQAQALCTEFAHLQNLTHPNILTALKLFHPTDDWAAFTAPWIDGSTPHQWLWRANDDVNTPKVNVDDETLEFSEALLRVPAPSAIYEPRKGLNDPLLSANRFEHLATQLFDALAWLRRNRIVHGDIKHANLCVENGGRLILLDFGSARPSLDTHEKKTLTPNYAAPEVLRGQFQTYASDIYSAAVVLFELATRNRFSGGAQKSFHQRLRELRRAGVDGGMARALASALEPNPEQRPWASEATRWFARRRLKKLSHETLPFVGRKALVQDILTEFETQRNQAIVLTGPPGIGKSALANHIATTWSENARAFCFWGVCQPFEHHPFQSLHILVDSAKDALSARGDSERAQQLWPTPDTLELIFPDVPLNKRHDDETAFRSFAQNHLILERAFDELSDTIHRISENQNILMVIDDAQWIDVDSLHAFFALMRRHPFHRVSILLTAETPLALKDILPAFKQGQRVVQFIDVPPLTSEESADLSQVISNNSLSNEECQTIYRLSEGSPLAITGLARWAIDHMDALTTSPSIQRSLMERLQNLSPHAQRVVQLLAAARRPLPASLLASLVHNRIENELHELELQGFIWVPNTRAPDVYAIRHQLLQAAIQTVMTEQSMQLLLRQLAPVVSEQLPEDPEFIARIWMRLNDDANTIHWMRIAARRAYAHFALHRAVALYRELLSFEPKDAPHLHVELAECLALLGAMTDAAEEYLKLTTSQVYASNVDYRIIAAELLSATGNLDLAEEITEEALERASCIRFPGTPRALALNALHRRNFPKQLSMRAIRDLATNPLAQSVGHTNQIEAHRLAAIIYGQKRLFDSMFHETRAIELVLQGAPIDTSRRILAMEIGFGSMIGPTARDYIQRVERVTHQLYQEADDVTPVEQLVLIYSIGAKELSFGDLEAARRHFVHGSNQFFRKYINSPWFGLSCAYFATHLLVRNLETYEARELLSRAEQFLTKPNDAYFGGLFDLRVRLYLALVENEHDAAHEILGRWPLPRPSALPTISETWTLIAHIDVALYEGKHLQLLRKLPSNPLVSFTTLLATSQYIALEFAFAVLRLITASLKESLPLVETLRLRAIRSTIVEAFKRIDSPHARCYLAAFRFSTALHERNWDAARRAFGDLTLDAGPASARVLELAARIAALDTPAAIQLTEADERLLDHHGVARRRHFARQWIP